MIRFATTADIDCIVQMGAAMHAESRFARLPYSIEKCQELVASTIANPEEMVGMVYEQDHAVIGVLLGFIDEHFFTNARVASDVLLYVIPERRGSMAGPRLLDYFTAWAKTKKADLIEVGISTGISVEKSSRLYQRLGYKPVGLVFEYEDADLGA